MPPPSRRATRVAAAACRCRPPPSLGSELLGALSLPALALPCCRARPAARQQRRSAPAGPVQASAYAPIGLTDPAHTSGVGAASVFIHKPGKKMPIAYSPEWLALREHTKEIDNL